MAAKVDTPPASAIRRGVHPGLEHGFDIRIDGAIGYRVRLIPSNRVLDSYPTAKEAFARVLAEISAGRSERTLIVDSGLADGSWHRLSAGRILRGLAQAAWGRHDPPPRKPHR
jgi:hypothetical protein